jgi:hypothetical protein
MAFDVAASLPAFGRMRPSICFFGVTVEESD